MSHLGDLIDAANAPTDVTSRGTRIVKKGEGLGQDAFLKILTAELQNQNPTDAKDNTEFVAQMAQFSSLEQMTNISNGTTFNTATSLVGKNVTLSSLNYDGKPYSGVVKSVKKQGTDIKLVIPVDVKGPDGKITKQDKEFSYSDVTQVSNS